MLNPKKRITRQMSQPSPVLSGQLMVMTLGSPGLSGCRITTTSSEGMPICALFPFYPSPLLLNHSYPSLPFSPSDWREQGIQSQCDWIPHRSGTHQRKKNLERKEGRGSGGLLLTLICFGFSPQSLSRSPRGCLWP